MGACRHLVYFMPLDPPSNLMYQPPALTDPTIHHT
jgi:hypothetical protein